MWVSARSIWGVTVHIFGAGCAEEAVLRRFDACSRRVLYSIPIRLLQPVISRSRSDCRTEMEELVSAGLPGGRDFVLLRQSGLQDRLAHHFAGALMLPYQTFQQQKNCATIWNFWRHAWGQS